MSDNTQNHIAIIDERPDKGDEASEHVRKAGFSPVLYSSPSELGNSQTIQSNNSTAAVLCCIPSVEHEAEEWLQKQKLSDTTLPVLCYTPRFREEKRIRLIEHGADELIQESSIENLLEELLPKYLQKAPAEPEEHEESRQLSPETSRAEKCTMQFQITKGEISNVLQFLCTTSREGLLEVLFPDNQKAEIFIADKTLTKVSFAENNGVQALAAMLNTEGERQAYFFEGQKTSEPDTSKPLSQFLLEASVLADETQSPTAEG